MAPVIPPLIILSVFGVYNLVKIATQSKSSLKRNMVKTLIGALLIIPLYLNAAYAYEHFKYVDPLPYLSGKVSRDEYINRFNPEYPLMVWANAHLNPEAQVLLMFVGNRSYYLDRDAHLAPDFVMPNIDGDYTAEDILIKMNRYGTTHIIIGYPGFLAWLNGLPNPENRDMFLKGIAPKHARDLIKSMGLNYWQWRNDEYCRMIN